jgi:hypothetical protein
MKNENKSRPVQVKGRKESERKNESHKEKRSYKENDSVAQKK